MLSKIPISLDKVGRDDVKKEALRVAIIAELDAINLYEQLAAITDDENLKKVFLDIAKEEKTHVGEFQALLLQLDAEQVEELEEGKREVEELIGK
ncbi:MAG: ferritin family protein [Candidatus Freyarchaeota archaeon]|mgnify:CR=1 FL=1|nr:ferritin family protein [Candidatus Freyrarchaeum guaymaensis]